MSKWIYSVETMKIATKSNEFCNLLPGFSPDHIWCGLRTVHILEGLSVIGLYGLLSLKQVNVRTKSLNRLKKNCEAGKIRNSKTTHGHVLCFATSKMIPNKKIDYKI
jgi:hypothetical protein